MRSRAYTRFNHRRACVRKRAGGMQHDTDMRQRFLECTNIFEVEREMVQFVFDRERSHRRRIASCQQRMQPDFDGPLDDEPTRVPVRAIKQEVASHDCTSFFRLSGERPKREDACRVSVDVPYKLRFSTAIGG
jgi:hypothetical protein